MRKAILFILMLGFLSGQSQQFARNYTLKQTLLVYTMDGDTNYTWRIPKAPIIWTSAVQWYGLDQTDGSIKVQYSTKDMGTNVLTLPPDSTFIDYPLNPDSLLLNSANGVAGMVDMWQGTSARWIRWKIDSGTCSAGSLELNVNLINKE